MSQILTGTWEEIKTHDAELVGRHMRVIVDDEEQSREDETSARLAAFDSWITAPRPQNSLLLDDSRVSIYSEDRDRG